MAASSRKGAIPYQIAQNTMKTFSKVLTRAEYEEGEVICPHCSSDNVEQSRSVFYPITSKKSA